MRPGRRPPTGHAAGRVVSWHSSPSGHVRARCLSRTLSVPIGTVPLTHEVHVVEEVLTQALSLGFSLLRWRRRDEGVALPAIMRVAEIRELQGKDTFVVKNSGLYPVVGVESGDVPAVGLAGARLLTETSRVTGLGDEHSPTAGISAERPLVIDVDATLVNVHSEKEGAAPTFKKGFGYHPLTAWFDHGTGQGAGECAAIMLRPGNAGSNTAADHIEIIRRALDQAGLGARPGRRVLVRIDGAGGTKETT